jgi:hypothetical protein
MKHDRLNLERVRFSPKILLDDRDLNDETKHESRLRGLHVCGLHETWGIAQGFVVALADDRKTVSIGPGLAYDGLGREVVLSRMLALDPPLGLAGPITNHFVWLDLVMRYREIIPSDVAGRPSTCFGGLSFSEERPEFRWAVSEATHEGGDIPLAADVRLGLELPLARFQLRAGKLVGPDYSFRRYARGLVRPHIAHGVVPISAENLSQNGLMWTVPVDTSSAGFIQTPVQTPIYFAHLMAHPLVEQLSFFEKSLQVESREVYELLSYLLGPFLAIQNPSWQGFTLEVRMGLPLEMKKDVRKRVQSTYSQLFESFRMNIYWLGIESVAGCPIKQDFSAILHWSGIFILPEIQFSIASNLLHFGVSDER